MGFLRSKGNRRHLTWDEDIGESIVVSPFAEDFNPHAPAGAEKELEEELQEKYTQLLKAYQKGNGAEALPLLDRVIEIALSDPGLLSMRADILLHLGKYGEALVSIKRALSLDPNEPQIWMLKGKIHAESGDNGITKKRSYDNALMSFNTALNLDPENIIALHAKIQLLAVLQQWEEVRDTCNELLRQNPTDFFTWFRKISAHIELQEWEEARKGLEESMNHAETQLEQEKLEHLQARVDQATSK